MLRVPAILIAAVFAMATPVLAQPPDRGSTPGLGWGGGGSKPDRNLGAPGPEVGVGLPAVVLGAGYLLLARRKRRARR